MKKLMLILILLTINIHLMIAQETGNATTRFIAVTGSAEVNIQPDEIELEIVLKEYGKQKTKVISKEINKIEAQFFIILQKNNIGKDKIIFNSSSSSYWYYWWNNRDVFYKEKSYTIKLEQSTDFLSLMKDLNIKGVSSLSVSKTTNKKLQKLRKEVKIKAVQAAKAKAKYLLESIDEKLGGVISIEEVDGSSNYWRGNQNMMSNAVISSNSNGGEMDNVANIKLRYEVKAKFGIQ